MEGRNDRGHFAPGNKLSPGKGKKVRRIEHILEKIGQEEVDWKGDVVTNLEAILRKVYDYAFAGQSWAVQFIAERTEGKVRDTAQAEVEVHRTIRLLDYGEPFPGDEPEEQDTPEE